jgi:hypothetical protein
MLTTDGRNTVARVDNPDMDVTVGIDEGRRV